MTTSKEVYDKLANLYTIDNTGQKISLRNQLRDVRMDKGELVASFFMEVTEIRDQLQGMGELVIESEMVTTTINGLPDLWDGFVGVICARKDTPSLDELWITYTKEESRLKAKGKIQELDSQAFTT